MIDVVYFSASGHCKKIAEFCASYLKSVPREIPCAEEQKTSERLLVVFPVFCQNVPLPVKEFISNSRAKYAAFVAVYGGKSFGHVLCDAQKLFKGTLVAAAYFPSGHSYLNDDRTGDAKKLVPLLDALSSSTQEVFIPKTPKNVFADLAPSLRSRLGVRLIRSDKCNSCHACDLVCPVHAIVDGVPDKSCIRCLKCVHACPRKALTFSLSPAMKRYLTRCRKIDVIVYRSRG